MLKNEWGIFSSIMLHTWGQVNSSRTSRGGGEVFYQFELSSGKTLNRASVLLNPRRMEARDLPRPGCLMKECWSWVLLTAEVQRGAAQLQPTEEPQLLPCLVLTSLPIGGYYEESVVVKDNNNSVQACLSPLELIHNICTTRDWDERSLYFRALLHLPVT